MGQKQVVRERAEEDNRRSSGFLSVSGACPGWLWGTDPRFGDKALETSRILIDSYPVFELEGSPM